MGIIAEIWRCGIGTLNGGRLGRREPGSDL